MNKRQPWYTGLWGKWTWRELADWSRLQRSVVCVLLAACTYALPWWLLTRPDTARISTLAMNAETLQAELQHRPQLVSATSIPADTSAKSQTPAEIPEFLATMVQMAQTSGVGSEQFRPGREIARIGPYLGTPVALRLTGTWSQITTFFEHLSLSAHGMLISVDDMDLRASVSQDSDITNRSTHLPLELQATVFVWQPDLARSTATSLPDLITSITSPSVPTALSFLRDPFTPLQMLTSTPHRTALEQYPLAQLSMLGTLDTDQGRFGLLLTPDGQLHRVSPGTRLGQHQGRVSAIHRDRIEVIEQHPDGQGGQQAQSVWIGLK